MSSSHDEHNDHAGGASAASLPDDPILKGTQSAHSMRKRVRAFVGIAIILWVVDGITRWAAGDLIDTELPLGGTTSAVAQPLNAAPYGCRGPEDDLVMPAGRKFVLPDHCLFNFNVTAGSIYLQDEGGGEPIKISTGQKVDFPAGFHPKRMWSAEGAVIQPEFYPA